MILLALKLYLTFVFINIIICQLEDQDYVSKKGLTVRELVAYSKYIATGPIFLIMYLIIKVPEWMDYQLIKPKKSVGKHAAGIVISDKVPPLPDHLLPIGNSPRVTQTDIKAINVN